MSHAPTPNLDPYTAKAEAGSESVSAQDKITDLHKIIKAAKTGMLTTRSDSGQLHSRAMIPSSLQTVYPPSPAYSETDLTLVFISNNASHKHDEIKNDEHVNVSFSDTNTTSWVSYSGVARITRDPELIKKHWSTYVAAYFGDLKDGVHKGDEHDPRVSVIEVIPNEIRYWHATQGSAARAVNTAVTSVMGGVSAPGELRTITEAEIKLTQKLHTK